MSQEQDAAAELEEIKREYMAASDTVRKLVDIVLSLPTSEQGKFLEVLKNKIKD